MSDAFNLLNDKRSGAVYVYNQKDEHHIMGVVRWDQIRQILTIRTS